MKRQVYLSMKGLEEARDLFLKKIGPDRRTDVETVSTKEALGLFTAEPVFARLSSPPFHSAAMDGIAVVAEKTYGTTERSPRTLKPGTDAAWVNTGQPLPGIFNSVIMVEKVHQKDDGFLEIRSPAYPWQHVRKVGEDIITSQLLLPQNHKIRPFDLGALISAGIFTVRVRRRPSVAIIPTGSELVNHEDFAEGEDLKENTIIESNSLILSGMVRECNSIPYVFDIIPDVEESIYDGLKKAVGSEFDVVIINAGSSAGSRDFTSHVISRMGEVLVHGVAMMPGKPTVLGIINGKPVIGIPGYPVSATISFDQFVKPLLFLLQGSYSPRREIIKVKPTRDIPSKLGTEEFVRVNIGKVGSDYVATPLSRTAGAITTLTKAEGFIRIPAPSEGISQEDLIEAELLVSEEELLNTVVVIGSHDITIDVLADEIRHNGHNIRISSGNVGSLGGIMALRKGVCHIAGTHLLDGVTGEYNIPFIRKYLKGMSVSIFHLALRDQGLIVAKGNPKHIKGIEDLTRDDIAFINRQAGSGTRILFDYRLNRLGIKPESITGYNRDEFTHMAVAVDVLSGSADCGMGIYAAARALDLDFIPMEREQYDIVIPTPMLDQINIRTVLETIGSRHFRERVISLGGYDPSNSGDLWVEMQL